MTRKMISMTTVKTKVKMSRQARLTTTTPREKTTMKMKTTRTKRRARRRCWMTIWKWFTDQRQLQARCAPRTRAIWLARKRTRVRRQDLASKLRTGRSNHPFTQVKLIGPEAPTERKGQAATSGSRRALEQPQTSGYTSTRSGRLQHPQNRLTTMISALVLISMERRHRDGRPQALGHSARKAGTPPHRLRFQPIQGAQPRVRLVVWLTNDAVLRFLRRVQRLQVTRSCRRRPKATITLLRSTRLTLPMISTAQRRPQLLGIVTRHQARRLRRRHPHRQHRQLRRHRGLRRRVNPQARTRPPPSSPRLCWSCVTCPSLMVQ